MIKITAEIRAFIDKAAAGVELAEDEYIDLSDGLIHCKKCGGQRQTVVPCFGKSGYFMPHCICQCQQEAEEQRKAAEERQRRMERIKRRKAQGLQDRYLYDYTFANDNGKNPLMNKAYVAYRKAGYSKKFREKHEEEILLHQAAKNAFDEMGVKKLPKVKELQTEYAKLLEEKKKTYAEYRRSREEMRELLTAKANVDRVLKMEVEQDVEKEKDHGQR